MKTSLKALRQEVKGWGSEQFHFLLQMTRASPVSLIFLLTDLDKDATHFSHWLKHLWENILEKYFQK